MSAREPVPNTPLAGVNLLGELGDLYQTEFGQTEKVDSQKKSAIRIPIDMFEQIKNATFESSEEDEKDVDKVRNLQGELVCKVSEEAYEFDFSEKSGASGILLQQEMNHVRSILKHKLMESSKAPSMVLSE